MIYVGQSNKYVDHHMKRGDSMGGDIFTNDTTGLAG